MNILHIADEFQNASGVSVFCGEMANAQAILGHQVCIWVHHLNADDCYIINENVTLTSYSEQLGGWEPEVVHIHGVWSVWLIRAFFVYRKYPIVWSPHGSLTPWAFHHKWWKKVPAWWCYQFWTLRRAELIHVTAQSEVDDIRALRLFNPISLVPLGTLIPEDCPVRPARNCKRALFISRVHPKKGLLNLIDAWAQCAPKDWILQIAGPSEEHFLEVVLGRVKEHGIENQVVYLGAVYGEEKTRLYAQADLFVLPSFSENFGVVILEALAQACPVITTQATPWQSLETHRCGWWIPTGVPALVKALNEAFTLPLERLREMGARGYRWVKQDYQWRHLAQRLLIDYEGILASKIN